LSAAGDEETFFTGNETAHDRRRGGHFRKGQQRWAKRQNARRGGCFFAREKRRGPIKSDHAAIFERGGYGGKVNDNEKGGRESKENIITKGRSLGDTIRQDELECFSHEGMNRRISLGEKNSLARRSPQKLPQAILNFWSS